MDINWTYTSQSKRQTNHNTMYWSTCRQRSFFSFFHNETSRAATVYLPRHEIRQMDPHSIDNLQIQMPILSIKNKHFHSHSSSTLRNIVEYILIDHALENLPALQIFFIEFSGRNSFVASFSFFHVLFHCLTRSTSRLWNSLISLAFYSTNHIDRKENTFLSFSFSRSCCSKSFAYES